MVRLCLYSILEKLPEGLWSFPRSRVKKDRSGGRVGDIGLFGLIDITLIIRIVRVLNVCKIARFTGDGGGQRGWTTAGVRILI